MGIVFVPIYIHFIGIEAYGLIGIFVTLMALFSLLDFGLGAAINREMAKLSVETPKAQDMRDLLRTLEIPYWGIAGLIGLTVVILSPIISHHWVQVKSLTPITVQRAIMIMGGAAAFQWPMGLYAGALRGLQRQVILNGIDALMATFRGIGAVTVLFLISPTIEAFFLWQIVISIIHTGVVAVCLWNSLPKAPKKASFRLQALKKIWRFAAMISGTNIVATALRQTDKVILSRILSLDAFGYYSFASVVAINLTRFSGPVIKAVYPRMTSLLAIGAIDDIVGLYHKTSQAISVLMFPIAVVLVLYAKEILMLWTRDPVVTEHSYWLVQILVAGTALGSLMYVPYALQLASGWASLGFYVNLVSLFIAIPLIAVLTLKFGAGGAASAWVLLNFSYFIFVVQIMHRRLLPHEKWNWYLRDICLPFIVALISAGAIRIAVSTPVQDIKLVAYLVIVTTISYGATVFFTPVTRIWINSKISTLKEAGSV